MTTPIELKQDNTCSHNNFLMEQIKNIIEAGNYNRGGSIVEALIRKDIDLDPNLIKEAFASHLIISDFRRFELLKEIALELFDQGIFVQFFDDEVVTVGGRVNIIRSDYLPLGLINITKHNETRISFFKDAELADELLYKWCSVIKTRAKQIHESWAGRKGWKPWIDWEQEPGTAECPYQIHAEVLAAQQILKEEFSAKGES